MLMLQFTTKDRIIKSVVLNMAQRWNDIKRSDNHNGNRCNYCGISLTSNHKCYPPLKNGNRHGYNSSPHIEYISETSNKADNLKLQRTKSIETQTEEAGHSKISVSTQTVDNNNDDNERKSGPYEIEKHTKEAAISNASLTTQTDNNNNNHTNNESYETEDLIQRAIENITRSRLLLCHFQNKLQNREDNFLF